MLVSLISSLLISQAQVEIQIQPTQVACQYQRVRVDNEVTYVYRDCAEFQRYLEMVGEALRYSQESQRRRLLSQIAEANGIDVKGNNGNFTVALVASLIFSGANPDLLQPANKGAILAELNKLGDEMIVELFR